MSREPKYITPTGLKGKRGWTDGAIERFLGEPDEHLPNPHYSSGLEMRCYLIERAEAVEQTEEFKEWFAKASAQREARKKGAAKAVETKKRKTREFVENYDMKISIPHYDSKQELIQDACDHYNRVIWNGDGERATPDSDWDFLCRITLNFMRHVCTNYDNELDYVNGYLKGRVGRQDVSMEDAKFRTFKDRINAAAIEAYPWLR